MNRLVSSRSVIWLVMALVLGAALWSIRHDSHMSWDGDNAVFLTLGYALGTSQGYRLINDPAAPPDRLRAPGYPWLIAGATLISHPARIVDLIPTMQALNGLLYLLGIVLVWCWASQRSTETWIPLVITWLYAAHPLVLQFADDVMSEVPYLAVSLAGLLTAERWFARKRALKQRHLAALALLSAATIYMRSIGVALPLAVGLWLLRQRRRRELAAFIGWLILMMLSWSVRTALTPGLTNQAEFLTYGAGGHIVGFGALGRRIMSGLVTYWSSPSLHPVNFARFITGVWPLQLLSFLAILTGFAQAMRRQQGVSEWYVLGFIGVCLLWHEHNDRFLIPLIPFLLWYWCAGIIEWVGILSARWPSRNRREIGTVLTIALCVLGLAAYIPSHVKQARRIQVKWEDRAHPHRWSEYLQAIRWVSVFTKPDDVILCRKPYLMYVYSQRRAVQFPFGKPDEVAQTLARTQSAYIVEDQLEWSTATERFLAPALQAFAERAWVARVAWFGSEARTTIWRVTPTGRAALKRMRAAS